MIPTSSKNRSRRTHDAIPAYVLYGETLNCDSEHLFHIETIAERSQLHDWHIRAHQHIDLQQFLLLRRGSATIRLDAEERTLAGPCVVVVPSGVIHAFKFEPGTAGLVISVAIPLLTELIGADVDLPIMLDHPSAKPIGPSLSESTDIWPLGEMLLREFGRSAHGRQIALRGLLSAILGNLLRLMLDLPGSEFHQTGTRELLGRFRELLESQFRQHLPISRYAIQLGISESRLRRCCVSLLGKAPIEIMQQRLLLEAQRLLRYTSMPVSQVAYHLGYEDPAYFSRVFSRGIGTSPRRFRLHAWPTSTTDLLS
jgi:AraC family transcriptional activator of pobA